MQHNENANPPTFFLTLDSLLQLMAKEDNMVCMYVHNVYIMIVIICVCDGYGAYVHM